MSFGPTSDRERGRQFERAMAIGQSSRGGFSGFSTNLFLNSGYTFGIIGEMLAEEVLLFLGSIATGGALAPTMVASVGSKLRHFKKLGTAYDIGKTLQKSRKYVNALDNMKDLSMARKVWEYTKGAPKYLGKKLAPDTFTFFKSLDEMKDFSGLAKTSTGFASFYKDVRTIRLAYGESSLEAGMVENEMLDQLYYEKKAEVGNRPLTEEENVEIAMKAKDAALTTFKWNLPVIWGSNQIVLDNLFHTFSPTRRLLSKPILKNSAGEIIKTASREAPLELFEYGAKGFFKSLAKPRTYWKAGLGYFKANIAEGLQETAQEIISKTAKDYHRLDPSNQTSQQFYSLMLDSAKDQWSPEGLETFASGFFMGGPVSMVTGSVSKVVDKVRQFRDPNYKENKAKAVKELTEKINLGNRILTDPNNWESDLLKNAILQKKIQEGLEEAKADGDVKGFHDQKFLSETSEFMTAIEHGFGPMLIERLEELKQITEVEELKELFPKLSEEALQTSSTKIDEKISMIKELERDWNDIKKKFPNPSNPNAFKPGSEERNAAKFDEAQWDNALKLMLFNKHAVKDSLKRMNGILDAASKAPGLQNRTSDEITSLFNTDTLMEQLGTKGTLLAAYGPDVQYNKDTQEITGIETLKKQLSESDYAKFEKKLKEFDALVDYSNKLKIVSSTSIEAQNYQTNLQAAQDSFNQLLTLYSDDNIYLDQLEEMFVGVLDYLKLEQESNKHREVYNTLLNPQRFLKAVMELSDAAKAAHKQRLPYLKAALEEFMKHMATQQLVNDLYYADQQDNFKEDYSPGGIATQGMFFDPEQLDALVNGEPPVEPSVFYYVSDGHEQVIQNSKDYKIAKSIIRHYIKNVREKEIEGAVPETEYNTKTRDKLPGDERTYEDLADQFGFEADKAETIVSKRRVLQAIIASDYATPQEKELAKELLKITEESESINFVNDHPNPGTYYSDGDKIVIDARYNSYDYKGGTVPIEYVILHEEIHRRTVKAYETDSQFKEAVDDMLAKTEEASKDLPADQKPYYGTKNAREFIAEAMTNEEFQKFLGQIEYDTETEKSVWAKFVDAVLEFLSDTFGKEVDNSVLNSAMDIITSKIESEFADVKDESITVDKVSPNTPFSLYATVLQRRLLKAFRDFSEDEEKKPVDERVLPVKQWKRLNNIELKSSEGFKNWVRNSDTAADIIDEWNLENVEQEEEVKAPLYYTGKNPTSTVLLTKEVDGETQVLLVKRADDAVEGNKWALPGGFVDSNAKEGYNWTPGKETTQQAAVREVKEETGLDVEEFDIESIYLKDDQGRDPRNSEESWIEDHGFRINLPEDFDMDPVGQDDAKEAKWFTLEELNELNDNELAFDHAEILAENNLRDVVEEPTGETGDLKVGDTVKINTPKDGTGVIKSIENGKVTLEDGRHGILLKNVQKISPEEIGPKESFNQSSASKKKAALVRELKNPETPETVIRGTVKINPKTGDTVDKVSVSTTKGYIMTDTDGREFTFYAHDKAETTVFLDFPTKGDLLQKVISDGRSVELQLFPELVLDGKTFRDVIAVKDTDTGLRLGYVRETDNFEQKGKPEEKDQDSAEEALNEAEKRKAEKLKPLVERRNEIQEELDKLNNLLRPKSESDNRYFSYPKLSYEEGLNNVLAALSKIKEYTNYNIDEVEQLLVDLGASDFIKTEFAKIKDVLKEAGVVMKTTLGENVGKRSYAEFRIESNDIVLNLGLLLADPKIETANDIAQIIAHEMVHGATVYKTQVPLTLGLDFLKTTPLTEVEQAAIADLNAVLKELQSLEEFENVYGVTNINEMLAELMNESFVNKLKNTTLKGETLWKKLVNAIVALLSGVTPGDNAYERIYRNYEVLLEQDATPQREATLEYFRENPMADFRRGQAIQRDIAVEDRKIEYDLLKKQSEAPTRQLEWVGQLEREERLSDRSIYNRYKTDAGNLNIDQVREQIKTLQDELASIDAQIEQIENEFYQETGQRRTYLLPFERKALEELGYTRADMRTMRSTEARDIIRSGQRVEDRKAIELLKAKEAERKAKQQAAKEKAQIRKNFTKLLDNVTDFEEFVKAENYAREILGNPTRLENSGYTVQEIETMLNAKKAELSKAVSFEIIKVGDVVMLGDNANNQKFVVTKKTKKQLKIRKFGDPAAEERAVNAQDVKRKIKYMSKDVEEPALPPVEPTPEEKDLIKGDQDNVKDVLNPDAIDQILDDSLNKTDDEANDDWSNSMRDNCAG
jgi:8-oxo-dGTP diphosphatase